jgi:hypothetical protein
MAARRSKSANCLAILTFHLHIGGRHPAARRSKLGSGGAKVVHRLLFFPANAASGEVDSGVVPGRDSAIECKSSPLLETHY